MKSEAAHDYHMEQQRQAWDAERGGEMKTLRDKYYHDPQYHALVQNLIRLITDCRYTPSEMREACILASIIYEENRPHDRYFKNDEKVLSALNTIDTWLDKEGE